MHRAHALCDLVIRDERLGLIDSDHCFPLGLQCMSPPLCCSRETGSASQSSLTSLASWPTSKE